MNQTEIKKQAKEILDKFAKALEKVKSKENFYVERDDFEREEINNLNKEKSEDFKQYLLENSPKKNNDFVIAEKGEWK